MNLRQLRYFCEIVDAGSSAAAAARVHVAPTALSMQLGLLEEELGGELFDRTRRPMVLTALGRYFHPRARLLLADSGRLLQDARAVAAGRTGVLAIGYTRSTIFSILPRAIRHFRGERPDVKVEMSGLLSEHQEAALRSGAIQVGVSRFLGPVEPAEGLVFERLLDDPFVVAVPTSHPLARRRSVRARELDGIGLITYPKDPKSHFAEHTVATLRTAGGQSDVVQEAGDIHTALGMAASHLGFCLVGRSVASGGRVDLAFVPCPDLKDRAAIFAVTLAGEETRLVSAFLDSLRATSATRE